MSNEHQYRKIHFVGIGGIGMSALAQLFQQQGIEVTGSDAVESPVTDLLQKRGIAVHIGHEVGLVHSELDLLVYSDAIPKSNVERVEARRLGILERSYFEALGEATKQGTSIVVAGTHGKTSTTAMLAKALIDVGKDPTVVAGSILSEYGSNFVAGRSDLYVVEGCEYRRHFLHLHPDILIITNIELDHTDYYKDLADIQHAFCELTEHVPSDGVLVTDTDAPNMQVILSHTQITQVPYQMATIPPLNVPGAFNVQNAQAAKTAAYALDPDLCEADIDASLASFSGTWRRFEYKGVTKQGAIVYDDYAHHPTAVQGTLNMVRKEFSDKKVVVVFHPHLYSRTRDFMDDFADALACADIVLIAPIYAAREQPIDGVTSMVLAERIIARGTPARAFGSLVEIQEYLEKQGILQEGTVLLTMGAGDVYKLSDDLAIRC